jgi:hypothetical protein
MAISVKNDLNRIWEKRAISEPFSRRHDNEA